MGNMYAKFGVCHAEKDICQPRFLALKTIEFIFRALENVYQVRIQTVNRTRQTYWQNNGSRDVAKNLYLLCIKRAVIFFFFVTAYTIQGPRWNKTLIWSASDMVYI